MAIIKCKMCGGDIELSADKTYGTCDSCGSTMTFPKVSDEQRANLFNRANHFRRQNEFDKAVSAYERILDQDDTDAEAHWGVVLSRFGIEYVEDPATHERIPTCHRVQATSILTDADYLAALEHAPDGYSRSLYEAEAKRIAEIQKGILAISAQEKPYDVFICYKESTDGGSRTKDSTLAQDIYYQLTQEGYKVFFSRITLEEKLGQQYEPYIFAALNSAKVMLVVGTKPEYFNAVWVKNEWSRYLALMKQDRSRLLIPCYRDMDAYDLPDELSALQSQDMSKIGFMQDLIRGVKKVLGGDAEQKVQQEVTKAPGVASLIKRARLFLEDADFASADEYAEKVLDIDPECAEAYLVKLLVSRQQSNESELEASRQSLEHDPNYVKALRFAKGEQATAYAAIEQTIQQNIQADQMEADYQHAMALYQKASDERGYLKAAEAFAALGDYQDAEQMIVSSKEKAQQKHQEHEEMLRKAQARAEQERIRKKQEEEERAAKQAQQELERKHAEEQKQLKRAEQRKKNKKLAAILAAVFAVVLAIGLTVKLYVLPKQTYDNASALLSTGQHDDAIASFAGLDGWGDSAERLKESYYAKAQQQLAQGELDAAAATFALAGDYSDAADQIGTIEAYQAACLLLEEGKTTEARKAFAALAGYQNADALYAQCCQTDYETAGNLMAELDVAAAYAMYVDLGDYSDAAALAAKIEQDYTAAGELMTAGQYTEAADAYALLGNYGESKEQKHSALYQHAEGLFAAGQHDEAATQFEAIGESQQAHAVLYAKAEGLYAAGQHDEAAAQFEAIGESQQAHAVLYAKAEGLFAAGQHDEAAAQFETINEIQRANEVLYAKAEGLLEADDQTGAEAVWEALGDYSDAADRLHALRLQIADEAFAAKDYALALEYYQKLIQTDDVKAKEYTLAQTAYDAGAYEQAVLAYEALGQYELSVSRLPVARYAWAEQLYTAGDYDAAAEQFTILDDFTDSSARASDAIYQHGKQLLEAAAYDDAKAVFTSLGTYEDAAAMCKECDYQKAAGLMADGSYADAAALFRTLGTYSDSWSQKQECEYLLAGEAFDAADYTTAEQLFSSLGEYKDAADQTKLSMYNQAGVYFAATDYENAQTIYSALGEYEDSQTMVNECRLQKALLHQQSGEYEKAVAELEDVEHGNSTQVRAECCMALGDQLLAQGKVDESVPYYAKATSLPEVQEKLYQIGKDYAATNQVEKAIETLYFVNSYKDTAQILVEIGNLQKANEQFDLALIAYWAAGDAGSEAANMSYDSVKIKNVLIILQTTFSLHHEDKDAFQKALRYQGGKMMIAAEQYEKAEQLLAGLIGYQDTKQYYYEIAERLQEEGKWKKAYYAFEALGSYSESNVKAKELMDAHPQLQIFDAKVGGYVTFGRFEQDNIIDNGKEPIEWLVLKKGTRGGKQSLLVISRYVLDYRQFHSTSKDDTTWESCVLRSWLNGDFFVSAFSEEEQLCIPKMPVPADKHPAYSSGWKVDPGNSTQDRVFLLSAQELEEMFSSEAWLYGSATPYARGKGANAYVDWWTRTPGKNDTTASVISRDYDDFVYSSYGVAKYAGVRPAMWIEVEP